MPNEFRPPTISSAPNLRDTGGYATRDGGQVRTGIGVEKDILPCGRHTPVS